MLELKISEKDISRDPFAIMTWADQELTMALFASKPNGVEEDRVNSRLRILIGEEKAVLARIRGEEAALQKARAKMYTLGGLSKEFCRQFALAGKRIFRVGGKACTELAEDIRQKQGYEVGVIYDETFAEHHFLEYFASGYSEYRRALRLFKEAIRGRDAVRPDLSGEKTLQKYLREMYNTASPTNKYMSLLMWMQYRRCAAEFDRQTRDRLTDEAIDMITRLAGGFWDGNQPQPQGDQLAPDDPARGGPLPEDRRDWRLRTENGDGVEGKWMLLNGSFQSLKCQYVTNVAKCTVYFRKCTQCKRWIAVYSGTRLSCPGGCAAQRKKQTDANSKMKNQGIPEYDEKRNTLTTLNEQEKWVKAHFGEKEADKMKEYPNRLKSKWKEYRKKYKMASDPDEQERLGGTFKTEMRTIAREAKMAYEEYKERAATQRRK